MKEPYFLDIVTFTLFHFSMAEGVDNAAVICCFMTPEYQASLNCERELSRAADLRKPIVPCLLASGWKPSDWLGLITAGLLYIDIRDGRDINQKIDEIVSKVKPFFNHISLKG